MTQSTNKLTQFWEELKRRKVVRVITVYAAAAFMILEAVDIIFPRLGLPDWTVTLVIFLLAIGLVISVILSWIYDIHPEGGIVKTQPVQMAESGSAQEEGQQGKAQDGRDMTTGGEARPSPTGWKIATCVSVVIIIGLIAYNIFGGKRGPKIDESLVKSIAVLPFLNLSGDDTQDYLQVGITDEILSNLFKVKSFDEVRSLTSVLKYKDSDENIIDIAQALDVNYILEGTYKRVGDDMRITAQLIEAISDNHIWVQDYDLTYREVVGIPAEIALQIADHLKAFISGEEKMMIERLHTDNLEAYELLKQAIELDLFAPGTMPQKIDLARRAIEQDPNYAEAYAHAGLWTFYLGLFGQDEDLQSLALQALSFFDSALELDQNNWTAHMGRAVIYEWVQWEYIKANDEILKAVSTEPNNPGNCISIEHYLKMNRLRYGVEFYGNCRAEEGLPEGYETGVKIPAWIKTLILSGNDEEATKELDSYLSKDTVNAPFYAGEIYNWMQQFDSARDYLEKGFTSENSPMKQMPRFQANLALAYHKTGDYELAGKIKDNLRTNAESDKTGENAYYLGWYYSWTGEADSAFYWIEKAVERHCVEIPWLKVDPAFISLKEDPRYWDLYARTGHKAYDDYMASMNQQQDDY